MTDDHTDEQQLIDEQVEETVDHIMDAQIVLTDFQHYSDNEYVMFRTYMRRRLEEFAYDVENRRGVRTLDPEEEACEEVSAEKVLDHLQSELQTAD